MALHLLHRPLTKLACCKCLRSNHHLKFSYQLEWDPRIIIYHRDKLIDSNLQTIKSNESLQIWFGWSHSKIISSRNLLVRVSKKWWRPQTNHCERIKQQRFSFEITNDFLSPRIEIFLLVVWELGRKAKWEHQISEW